MKSSNLSYTMVYACTLVYLKYTKNIQRCIYFNPLKIILILLTWIGMTELNMNWFYWHKYRFYWHEYEWTQLNWTELNMNQFSSVAPSCLTLCDPVNHSTPGLPVHHQLLDLTKLLSVESVMPSNHLVLCRPLFLLPSIFPTIRVFSKESVFRIRWPKYWSLSLNISASNDHPDWFPLGWTGWISLQSKGLSRVFSNTAVQNYQFFCAQLSL